MIAVGEGTSAMTNVVYSVPIVPMYFMTTQTVYIYSFVT